VLPGITCTDSDRSSAIVSDGGSGENGDARISPATTMKYGASCLIDLNAASRAPTFPFTIRNKGDSFTGHSVRSYPRSADMWPYDRAQWAAQH
jgi:hypothetical protein